jgi:hypothetical protein
MVRWSCGNTREYQFDKDETNRIIVFCDTGRFMENIYMSLDLKTRVD